MTLTHGSAVLYIGDVFDRMAGLPDGSVDLVVTSPPFLALRSYLPADHPDKALEIGSEATPAAFLDTLLRLTAEWRRLLAPHGSIAIELGDTYAGDDRRNHETVDAKTPHRINGRPGSSRVNMGPGWPLDKSLTGIPDLYAIALEYGINPLTGQPSPAGRWRVRNKIPWCRPNPPVGALGDKCRPATSYITVATIARNRWWDMEDCRTPHVSPPQRRFSDSWGTRPDGKQFDSGYYLSDEPTTFGNPAGAPLLDYWDTISTVIDDAVRTTGGPANNTHARTKKGVGQQARLGKSADRDGNWSTLDELETTAGGTSLGTWVAKLLRDKGVLDSGDMWVIPTQPYKGAHYATFPSELPARLTKLMCPRDVCTTCGEPRRRIVNDKTEFLEWQPKLAAHIKAQREVAGITSAEINGWFGYKEIAKNWERTDRHGAAIPNPDDWLILRDRLDLDASFDALVLGERQWTASTIEYERDGQVITRDEHRDDYGRGGKAQAPGQRQATRLPVREWTDCQHNTWRPGVVLDPFAGSGTTLAAATGLGRAAIGIDLDARNADLARQRVGMFLDVEGDDGERMGGHPRPALETS